MALSICAALDAPEQEQTRGKELGRFMEGQVSEILLSELTRSTHDGILHGFSTKEPRPTGQNLPAHTLQCRKVFRRRRPDVFGSLAGR